MSGVGMGGSARPKARAGDFERAWEVIVAAGGDKQTRDYLKELVAAEATYVESRERATSATSEAERREGLAREAEADARSQRTCLATETEETDARFNAERQELAGERRRLGEWDEKLKVQDAGLKQREDALKTAFRAYEGATI